MSRQSNKFLFVGGLHRSGTSALYKLVGSDPNISIFRDTGVIEDEGQFLQDIITPDGEYGGPGLFAFESEAHLTEQSPQVKTARECLFNQWSEHWDLSKPVLAEKSPANLIRSRFLQAIFPNTSFLFIMRHPIAACMATAKWTDACMTTLIKHWIKAHTIMFEDIKHLNRVAVLRYEDFTGQPRKFEDDISEVIWGISNFDWGIIKSGLNEKYYKKWRRGDYHLSWNKESFHPKDFFNLTKWWTKKLINKTELMCIRHRYESEIRKMGYSFKNLL